MNFKQITNLQMQSKDSYSNFKVNKKFKNYRGFHITIHFNHFSATFTVNPHSTPLTRKNPKLVQAL